MIWNRTEATPRLARVHRATMDRFGGPSPEMCDKQIADAVNSLLTGESLKMSGSSEVLLAIEGLVRKEAQGHNSPVARFNRDQAEAYRQRHEQSAPTPVAPTKIGASYASDFARTNNVDLAAKSAEFSRIARNESAIALRKAMLGEDASRNARRAAHFTTLAGESVDPDIATLSQGEAPRASDWG